MKESKPSFSRLPASHAAAALGLASWSTPLASYVSAAEGRPWAECPEEPPKGFQLVPALRDWASSLIKAPFRAVRTPFAGGTKLPFITAHVHGVTDGMSACLLLKTPRDLSRWFEEGDDGEERLCVPDDVEIEATLLRLIVAPAVYVAVLIGGQLRVIEAGHEADEGGLVAELEEFWGQVKAGGMFPAAEAGDEKLLRELFPVSTLPRLKWSEMSDDDRDRVERWAFANRFFNDYKKDTEQARPAVVQLLGEHGGVEIDGGRETRLTSITFDARAPSIQGGGWKAVAMEAMEAMSEKKRAALIKKHTPEHGPRVLRAFLKPETTPATVLDGEVPGGAA